MFGNHDVVRVSGRAVGCVFLRIMRRMPNGLMPV